MTIIFNILFFSLFSQIIVPSKSNLKHLKDTNFPPSLYKNSDAIKEIYNTSTNNDIDTNLGTNVYIRGRFNQHEMLEKIANSPSIFKCDSLVFRNLSGRTIYLDLDSFNFYFNNDDTSLIKIENQNSEKINCDNTSINDYVFEFAEFALTLKEHGIIIE